MSAGVSCPGFTSNVRVWEAVFDKTGGFREVIRAFELKGHSAGVYSFSFSEGSTRSENSSIIKCFFFWGNVFYFDVNSTKVYSLLFDKPRLAYSSALGGSLPHFKASFRPPAFSQNLPLSIKIWSTCVSGLDCDATDFVIDQLPWSQQSIMPIN